MLSKVLPFIEGIKWKVWLGAIAALLACLPVAYCQGRADMAEKRDKETAAAITKAVREARAADARASEQRQSDDRRNRDNDEARQDAARTGGRDAVNCERLRAAYPGQDIPACD